MFSRPTVFVIGAGASYELGFPLGEDLKVEIGELLNILFPNGHEQSSGDYQIASLLQQRAAQNGEHNWNYLLYKAWQIRVSLPGALSIDNVLDAHHSDPDLVFCGKLAICKSILLAEKKSKLYGDRRPHDPTIFQRVSGTFLIPLFQMLTEGVRKEELSGSFENLSIITFNYDRSIERFFPEALATYYGIDQTLAAEIFGSVKIIHPYGQVGALGWEDRDSVPYGADDANLSSITDRIRTFTEGIVDENLQSDIHNAYFGADTVVYLGFAFHPINLELLTGTGSGKANRVVGTAYGLAKPARDVAEDLVLQSLGKTDVGSHLESPEDFWIERIDLEEQTATGLLQSHFRAIV